MEMWSWVGPTTAHQVSYVEPLRQDIHNGTIFHLISAYLSYYSIPIRWYMVDEHILVEISSIR